MITSKNKRQERELRLVDIGEGYLNVKKKGLSFRYKSRRHNGKLTLTQTKIKWIPEGKHGAGGRTPPGPEAISLDLDDIIDEVKKGVRR